MTCQRPYCHGLIRDLDDGLGPRCWLCGRSPVPPPTKTQLLQAGVYAENATSKESEGHRKRDREYAPAGGGFQRIRSYRGTP